MSDGSQSRAAACVRQRAAAARPGWSGDAAPALGSGNCHPNFAAPPHPAYPRAPSARRPREGSAVGVARWGLDGITPTAPASPSASQTALSSLAALLLERALLRPPAAKVEPP